LIIAVTPFMACRKD